MSYPYQVSQEAQFETKFKLKQQVRSILNEELPLELINVVESYAEPKCGIYVQFECNPNSELFFGTRNTSKYENDIDFQIIMAQDITRALGFDTHLTTITMDENEIVIPKSIQLDNGTDILLRMSPMDFLVYNSPNVRHSWPFLSSIGRLLKRPKEMEPIGNRWKKWEDLGLYNPGFNISETSGRAKNIINSNGKYLHDSLSMGVTEAFFLDGEFLPLIFDDNKYEIAANFGQEFLLTPFLETSGKSLQELMDEHNNGELYGPRILQVLEVVGYATARNPRTIELRFE